MRGRRKRPSCRGRSYDACSAKVVNRVIGICCSLRGLGIINTLNLDQAGVWVGVALAALVAKVLAPRSSVSASWFNGQAAVRGSDRCVAKGRVVARTKVSSGGQIRMVKTHLTYSLCPCSEGIVKGVRRCRENRNECRYWSLVMGKSSSL